MNFGGVPVTEDAKIALKQFADKLSQAGCKVEKINPTNFDFMLAWQTWGRFLIWNLVSIHHPMPVFSNTFWDGLIEKTIL